jgi:predicted AlkP superfamily phosphohydrolase/phosphomutase
MGAPARRRVALIGLDAAELSFVQQHLSDLPTLRRLLETGTLHRLASTAGVFPGSVWPTFYSGRLPGDHGIYHHLQWDSETMQLRRVTEDWLYVEPFWYELERQGLHVAAIDVPMSFPSRLSRGVEIINWGSHDELGSFRTRPGHLRREIRRRFGSHPMGSEIPVRKTSTQLERIRCNLIAGAERKEKLSRWLLTQSNWDFFLTVFGETHRGGHLLWPEVGTEESRNGNALLDVYQAVDRSVGRLIEALPEDVTTIILFALHGMGLNDSQEHFIPKIMDRVNAEFVGDHIASDGSGARKVPSRQRSLMRMLRETLPTRLQNTIARAVPVGVRDLVVGRQISAGHDWGRTPGIALLADLNGYLRWNLQGRERSGMLDGGTEEAERYIVWVRECLLGLRISASGAALVRDVLLSREHFPGGRTAVLPDAIVRWNGGPPVSRIESPIIGAIAAERSTGRSGNHRPDGFCVIIERSGERGRHVAPPRHISELGGFVFRTLEQS